jgi:uncharacterized protein YbcI
LFTSSLWNNKTKGKKEEELRDKLNDYYQKTLIRKSLSAYGWTVEPVTKMAVMNLIGQLLVVGKDYASTKDFHTVIDLEMVRKESEHRVGINVKSQKYHYTISRVVNQEDPILSTFYSTTNKYLSYMRRNLISLTNYAAYYDDESENKKQLMSLYDEFFEYEKKVIYLYYLISALDGVRLETENPKNIYSILISYQGGFL